MERKHDFVEQTLAGIEQSIATGEPLNRENGQLELKDLSTKGDWKSLAETVCAYLNTAGGYVICGIREQDKTYAVTGFNRDDEDHLLKVRTDIRQENGLPIALSENVLLDYRMFANKTIAVITVLPLGEDMKFVHYNGAYYERDSTQDRVISSSKLLRQREHRAALGYSKELSPIKGASLADLSLDKINLFLAKTEATGRKETIKKDLEDARDFLKRRYCLGSDGEVTTLGLLLFGTDPFQQLEYRAEIDCFFETGSDISGDKRFFQGDVLTLMDDAFAFVRGHIKMGRSHVGGGRSEPEFPEKLIREVVNNALAHRDYTVNQFITLKVNPSEGIEIKNPGSFEQKMLVLDTSTPGEIRRVLPGMTESKNPKLASALKAFDKTESQGIGMATLVGICLDNAIDVPYYDLSAPDFISLAIPSGKLMDEETQRWIEAYHAYIDGKLHGKTTKEHEIVLAYLLKSERLNQQNRYTILLIPGNDRAGILADLKQAGLIYEHAAASTEQVPIYVLDPELMLRDFGAQIEQRTGMALGARGIDPVTKKALNIIYRYNHYNQQGIKPSQITPELYGMVYGKQIDPLQYESLGRRVHKMCTDLAKSGMLIQVENKAYMLRKQ